MTIKLILFLLSSSAFLLLAQGSGGASKIVSPVRGLVPYGSYNLGDTETIDEATGALQLRIPLAALPAGRAGHSAGIDLTYSSRIFDTFYSPSPGGPGTYEQFATQRSADGGWRYAYGVEIRLEQRSVVDSSNCSSNEELRRKFKVVAVFPDGSKHELRYSQVGNENQNDQTNSLVDGWYDFRPDGFREHPCTGDRSAISSATQFTWFTIDGTYVRLTFDRDDGLNWENNRWALSMPDGSKITGGNENQKIWDRNGNFIEIQNGLENGLPTTKLVQTISGTTPLVREVKIERNFSATPMVDKIYFRSPGGALQYHTIEKRQVQAQPKPYYCSDSATHIECYLSANITQGTFDPSRPDLYQYAYEVTRVLLANGQSYVFEYNSTVAANGWGEVSKMTLPTGGEVHYKYKLDNSPGGSARPPWRKTLLNSLTEKRVAYSRVLPNGTALPIQEITTFDFLRSSTIGIEWSENVITTPEGGVTKHYLQTPNYEPRVSKQAGLIRKTIRSDGSELDRIWIENIPDGLNAAASDQGLFMMNPHIGSELTARPLGSTPLLQLRTNLVEGNGNIIETRESDWFQAALDKSGGSPQYLASAPSPDFERSVLRTFYNQASASEPQNYYNRPDSPAFRQALRQESILNRQNSEVKKTELTYQILAGNPSVLFVTGNVVSRKDYEIPGGRIFTTLYEFDAYGNLTAETNARSVRSETVFGTSCGVESLHPTISKTAVVGGVAQAEVQRVFDCWTGLEVRSTQKGNTAGEEIHTVTRYDSLGREIFSSYGQLPQGEVGGSSSNVYRSIDTEYDDVNRSVIVRSDYDQVGPTRLRRVSVKHFDPMGQLRLSRELENAPDSISDENSGIRTVYLRGYKDNKRIEAASTPHRVSLLPGEPDTRGWIVKVHNSQGQLERDEVYESPDVPAYFVANGSDPASVYAYQYSASSTLRRFDNSALSWVTRTIDPAQVERIEATDGLGRVIAASEKDNLAEASQISVANVYAYDALDNVTNVRTYTHSPCATFPCATLPAATWKSQERTFTHDSLSRLRAASSPESGTATSIYDEVGNLVFQLQAGCSAPTQQGCIYSAMTYDEQNRILTASYSNGISSVGATPAAAWGYDDPVVPYSRGRLTTQFNANSRTNWREFDVLGNTLKSEQVIDGVSYAFEYKRNHRGALKWMKYPSGREVMVASDQRGRDTSISKSGGTGTAAYISNIRYYPSGAMLDWRLGNGLYESHGFNRRGQMNDLRLGTSAQSSDQWRLQNLFGGSLNNGNIISQEITLPGGASVTSSYRYDQRNRLHVAVDAGNPSALGCASAGGTFCQEFAYDVFGNRRVVADRGNGLLLNVPQTFDQASNRISDSGFIYDTRGNLILEGGGDRYLFDAANRIVLMCSGLTASQCSESEPASATGKTAYRYDAEGRRVAKVTSSGRTLYVYDSEGQLAAEYGGAVLPVSTVFITTDHLGSTRVLKDSTGEDLWRADYTPFGTPRTFSSPDPRSAVSAYGPVDLVSQQFAGKLHDVESRLLFSEARYYSAAQGRFVSPDSPFVDQQVAELSSWNLYAYGRSSPLAKTDPSGRTVIVCFTGWGCFPLTDEQYRSSFENNNGVTLPRFRFGQDEFSIDGIKCGGELCGSATYINDEKVGMIPIFHPVQDFREKLAPFNPKNWIKVSVKTSVKAAARTAPTLPPKTIARKGEVSIVHYYRSEDHGPPHVHVIGGGQETRVGQNGFPLDGDPELTAAQKLVVQENLAAIRQAIKKVGKYFNYNESSKGAK